MQYKVCRKAKARGQESDHQDEVGNIVQSQTEEGVYVPGADPIEAFQTHFSPRAWELRLQVSGVARSQVKLSFRQKSPK